jgi:hypothetical protein
MTRKSKPKNTKAGASQLHKTIPGRNKSAENNELRNTTNKTDNPKKIRPPQIPYDPNAIFGGDSDEDPYDYSDDEIVDNTRPHPLEEGYETDSSSQSLPWDSAPGWMQDANQDTIYDYDSDIDAALDAEFDRLHPISQTPINPPYASRSAQAPNQKDLDQVIHQANLYMNRHYHTDAQSLLQLSANGEHNLDPRSELAMSAMVDPTACECECGAAAAVEDPPSPPPSQTTPPQLHLNVEPSLTNPPPTTPLAHVHTSVTETLSVPATDHCLPNLRKLCSTNESPMTTDSWPEDLTQLHGDSPRPNVTYSPIVAWKSWISLPPQRPEKRPPRRPKLMKPLNFTRDFSLSANLRPRQIRPPKKPNPTRKGSSNPKPTVKGRPTPSCPRCTPWTRRKRISSKPRDRSTKNRIFKCLLIPFKIRKYRHTLPRNTQTSTFDPHVFPTHSYWEMKAG